MNTKESCGHAAAAAAATAAASAAAAAAEAAEFCTISQSLVSGKVTHRLTDTDQIKFLSGGRGEGAPPHLAAGSAGLLAVLLEIE